MLTCTHCGKEMKKKDAHYCSYVEYEDAENLRGKMMLTCAMCGKPMRECCDIYHVAKNKQGRECIICGDCAEELEAYAESQRKSAQEICKGHLCPEQTQEGPGADA